MPSAGDDEQGQQAETEAHGDEREQLGQHRAEGDGIGIHRRTSEKIINVMTTPNTIAAGGQMTDQRSAEVTTVESITSPTVQRGTSA